MHLNLFSKYVYFVHARAFIKLHKHREINVFEVCFFKYIIWRTYILSSFCSLDNVKIVNFFMKNVHFF